MAGVYGLGSFINPLEPLYAVLSVLFSLQVI